MAVAGDLPSPIASALSATARHAAPAVDPWWIIGSAAVALHAVETPVADVDLLTSARDAAAMLAAAGRSPDATSDRSQFRSVYGGLPSPGLPIEVMGGLEVRGADGWTRVLPASRLAVHIGDVTLYIPARAELVAILRAFGRPKDLARATLLD